MDITVTFRHTEPIESLKTYAEDKISKLRKYMDAPLEAHVVLTVEKLRHQADVSMSVNGTLVKAVEGRVYVFGHRSGHGQDRKAGEKAS